MKTLELGDKVVVNDPGLLSLYNVMKKFDPKAKLENKGWVDEIMDDGTIMVKFPIGNDDPDEHSQIAPYPLHMVEKNDWK